MNKKQAEQQRIAIQKYELTKKNPWAAVGASLLFTGLGQAYAGEWARGIIALVLCITLWFILLGWIVSIVAAIDAYGVTKKYNQKLALDLGLTQ